MQSFWEYAFKNFLMSGETFIYVGGFFTVEALWKLYQKKDHSVIGEGVIAAIFGVGCFWWAAPKMELLRSSMGQLAVGLGGDEVAKQVSHIRFMYNGGIIVMVLAAIVILSSIIVKSTTDPKTP